MITQELLAKYALERRISSRSEGADEELIFDFARDRLRPQLPIEEDGQLRVCSWGDRNRESRLPHTGWCKIESLEAGKWRHHNPKEILIPCTLGLEKGIWFVVDQGIRGIVVRDEKGEKRVYMLTQPSTVYFQNMTKHDRMPVLFEQIL